MNAKERGIAEEILEDSPKLPDCVKVSYQTFPRGSQIYCISTVCIREKIVFTIEIGHSYSVVKYGDIELYPDRIEVRDSFLKEYKTELAFYKGDYIMASIPLEKED